MTRRGQKLATGHRVDCRGCRDDVVTRRLPSLEGVVETYSRKAWFTIPSAHTSHGVDPNAPREPMTLDATGRLAARVVDEFLGGNPANLGKCDCQPCGCELRDVEGWLVNCEHDLACPHTGVEEDSEKVSARLRELVSSHPRLAQSLTAGVDAVYVAAGLTPAETQVARYKHEGLSHADIAFLTNRKEGTCYALYNRAKQELKALLETAA